MHEDQAPAHEASVGIVGCGPTGVMLANLLGSLGVRVWVIDRDPGVYPVPRATHLDEETLRNFQATGLMSAIEPHTSPFGLVTVADHDGAVLLEDEVMDRHTSHGYTGSRFFEQPLVEGALRAGLARYEGTVRLHTGLEAERFDLSERARVTVHARDAATGATVSLSAGWVVGCDGGRSATRAAVGVAMESVSPKRPWIIIDTKLRDPRDAGLLPGGFRYVLARERLTIYAHGHGAHRRWEFQLDEGEPTPDERTVLAWVAPFIDPARLEVLRVVPYAHTSLVARAWRVGRVLLAGDAAHMMPPSAGQGMCSGVRDAVNLAWKLARVVTGRSSEALLESYERERKPHVREILAGTLKIGERLEARTEWQRWRRRTELGLLTRLPAPVQDLVRRANLRHPMVTAGLLDEGSVMAGRHVPQTELWRDGAKLRSDDALGYACALVLARGVPCDEETRRWAEALGVSVWRAGEELVEVEGALARWMRAEGLAYALVRPDRVLFSAGPAGDLSRARAAFERGLR